MKWGDLISLEYGKPVKDKESTDGSVPVYGTNGQIGTSHLPPLCKYPSFIVGRKGAYRGVHYSPIPFSVIDTAFFAKPISDKIDMKWAYYKFLTYDINRMDSGSAIPSTDRHEIYGIDVEIPSIAEQKNAVAILDSLYNKIRLNERIANNLYDQARIITRQWLIDNEDEYELLPLAEVALINPDTYSPKENWEYVNYLDTSSITDGNISEMQHIILAAEKLPSRARRKITINDVVFSTVRPNQRHFGIINIPMPNMLVSTGFAVVRSNNPSVCNELIYLCLTENEFIERMQQLAEQSTSTFPSIKPYDLGVCKIPCLKRDVPINLTDILKSLFSLISASQAENRLISALCDTLLPKLMSGELDVSKVIF